MTSSSDTAAMPTATQPAAPNDRQGRLLLIPNTLDLGCTGGDGVPLPDLRKVLPMGAIEAAAGLRHWVAENAKSTRAFIKRVGEVLPLTASIQEQDIQVLPRPTKGGHQSSHQGGESTGGQAMGDSKKNRKEPSPSPADSDADKAVRSLLGPALAGHDLGLISEAGLPGVADPGATVVLAAHKAGIEVVAISGPNSLVLALAASGLHGQSFAFVGYLPVDATQRTQRLRELESHSRKARQTQLVIETPYRNVALWQALLLDLQPATLLSVSCGLTLDGGWSRTDTVARWRQQNLTLPADVPAVFCWLAL
jgi:16S rRNA (cytidine1402-2'-O)-methyltransferase